MRVIAIIMISFNFLMNIQTIDCRYYNNFIRNMKKSIVRNCNNRALYMTNNSEVYDCIMKKEMNCHQLENYTEYSEISENCIKINRKQFELGIVYSVAMWIGFGLFAAIMSGA